MSPLLVGLDGFVAKIEHDGDGFVYCTFLGGSFGDDPLGLALDPTGGVVITGSTDSTDFPTTFGAYDTTQNGEGDGFVVKLDPSGGALAYSTFVGGGAGDGLGPVCVDGAGRAYVGGATESVNFPTTGNAFQASYPGLQDGCLIRLSADGSTLEYSTYFGSDVTGEAIQGVALDDTGRVLVAGRTGSILGSSLPVTPGAFDETFNGETDAFVAKLDVDSGRLLYSTYLGGSNDEFLEDLAVDSTGAAIVTGWTHSLNLPTTPNAFDPFYSGGSDVFVAKLSPDGAHLLFGTLVGGGTDEQGHGVAVDGNDDIIVSGFCGPGFPTTSNGHDTSFNGGLDTFVVKLSGDGSKMLYGTYLGGAGNDRGYALALDAEGSAYVAGQTFSMDFPVTPGAADPAFEGVSSEAFVYKLAFPPWSDLGFAYAGTEGLEPLLIGTGPLVGGEPMAVTLQDALPSTVAWLVVGTQTIEVFPFYGGTLVPAFEPPGGFFVTLGTDGSGGLPINATWPTGVPAGLALYLQYWIVDPGAAFGLSASNTIMGMAAGD